MNRELIASTDERNVGVLREQNDLWEFEYDAGWIADPYSYDLSPALARTSGLIRDGASVRPVQWYFDNLLPENHLRDLLAKETATSVADVFGLLTVFGRESAGSLTLKSATDTVALPRGLESLPLGVLSARIAALPRKSLSHDAPKRMSLAGAQHKLSVVYANGELFEPLAGTPSSHILKPNHPSDEYPASAANEYFTMMLARRCGLDVPDVYKLYVPQPVYVIDRFDRRITDAAKGDISRTHAIDLCQLLNKPGLFKYTDATLEALGEAVRLCRGRARARTQLFRWIVFNALVGNSDNHLKNISFLVSDRGIELAPAYDLLSTAAYTTVALAAGAARWPQTELTLPLANTASFAEITRQNLIAAGETIGFARPTAARIVAEIAAALRTHANPLLGRIETEFTTAANESPDPQSASVYLQNEMRVLRTVCHVVIADMLSRIDR